MQFFISRMRLPEKWVNGHDLPNQHLNNCSLTEFKTLKHKQAKWSGFANITQLLHRTCNTNSIILREFIVSCDRDKLAITWCPFASYPFTSCCPSEKCYLNNRTPICTDGTISTRRRNYLSEIQIWYYNKDIWYKYDSWIG